MERPPLYAFFLAIIYFFFGHSFVIVRLIQTVLDSFSCIIIYRISQKIFANWRISLSSAILAIISPEMVASTSFILTETLSTFLLSTSVWLLIEAILTQGKANYAKAGFLLGLATLCRPVTLMFPLFLLIALVIFQSNRLRTLGQVCLFSLSMAAVMSPWTIRNYMISKVFLPVGVGAGANLWIGSYQPWDGDYNYKDLSDKLKIHEGASSQLEIDKRLRKEAIKNIKKDPFAYLRLGVKKFGRFWFLIPGSKELLKGKVLVKGFLYTIHFLLLLFFALGLWFSLRKWTTAVLPPLLIIFYFTLIHVILFSIPRYHIPITPFVIVFAATGLNRAIDLLRCYRSAPDQ